jgi:TetR/AcrR family transcriptional repressor of nem operon
MKKSKAETAETRKRILEVAARAFKSNGVDGTGVSEIMAAAGLTHGGFYRHFESKEQLVAEACAASMAVFIQSAEAATDDGRDSFLKHVGYFLSEEYRDDCLGGCPLVALGSELARSDPQTRHAASEGFQKLIDIVAKWNPRDDEASARDAAIFTLTSMVGAVTMARIVDDPALSDQILQIAKQRLIDLPAKDKPIVSKTPKKRASVD